MERVVNREHPFEYTTAKIESYSHVVAVGDFHGGILLTTNGNDVQTFESPIDICLILAGRPGKTTCHIRGDLFKESVVTFDKIIAKQLGASAKLSFEEFGNFVGLVANEGYVNRAMLDSDIANNKLKMRVATTSKRRANKSMKRQTSERVRSRNAVKVVKIMRGNRIFDKVYNIDSNIPGEMKITYPATSSGSVINERYYGNGVPASFSFTLRSFLEWLYSRGVRKAVFFDRSCNGFVRQRDAKGYIKGSAIKILGAISRTLGRRLEQMPNPAGEMPFNANWFPASIQGFDRDLPSDQEGLLSNESTQSSESKPKRRIAPTLVKRPDLPTSPPSSWMRLPPDVSTSPPLNKTPKRRIVPTFVRATLPTPPPLNKTPKRRIVPTFVRATLPTPPPLNKTPKRRIVPTPVTSAGQDSSFGNKKKRVRKIDSSSS
jgi:hypothetical protein